MADFELRKVEYGAKEYEETVDFRDEYFRKPQGLNIRDDDLSSDKKSNMYGGYIDDELVATIYYLEKDPKTAQIKAVITADSIRGQGYGKRIMDEIESKIEDQGYEKIVLEGRVSVEGFYENLGYERISEEFDIRTVPHIIMEKNLK